MFFQKGFVLSFPYFIQVQVVLVVLARNEPVEVSWAFIIYVLFYICFFYLSWIKSWLLSNPISGSSRRINTTFHSFTSFSLHFEPSPLFVIFDCILNMRYETKTSAARVWDAHCIDKSRTPHETSLLFSSSDCYLHLFPILFLIQYLSNSIKTKQILIRQHHTAKILAPHGYPCKWFM